MEYVSAWESSSSVTNKDRSVLSVPSEFTGRVWESLATGAVLAAAVIVKFTIPVAVDPPVSSTLYWNWVVSSGLPDSTSGAVNTISLSVMVLLTIKSKLPASTVWVSVNTRSPSASSESSI